MFSKSYRQNYTEYFTVEYHMLQGQVAVSLLKYVTNFLRFFDRGEFVYVTRNIFAPHPYCEKRLNKGE